MKILHIINNLEVGGAQKLLADLLPLLNKDNTCDLLVISKLEDNQFLEGLQKQNIKIYPLNAKRFYSIHLIWQIRNFIKQYDVVHVHLFPSLYLCALAHIGLKSKLFYTEHSTNNRRRNKKIFRHIEKFIYAKYDKIISISPQTEQNLRRWLCAKESDTRFVTINNGVDIEKYRNCVGKRIDNKNILMISRFVSAKDQATLIKAMQFVNQDYNLLLVGDGETLTYCKELVSHLNLTERVVFLGSRSDIPELISNAYIGVQSSNWEGFGLTAVEMMAGGLPVIASDVEGLKEVVEDAGLIFKKSDEKELAEKINMLISDEELYVKLTVNCVNRAKLYDINRMAEKYMYEYNEFMV